LTLSANGVIRDPGLPDEIFIGAEQHSVPDLPEETLVFVLGSRYCETDLLSQTAYVHHHIAFNYQMARATRTASEGYNERTGVCRDYAHLAIAFCRCMNIPARYCTGYLSDIGQKPPYGVGDFAAWIEVWIGGRWHMFDPRNNVPRIGRILMAYGRDASDVAIATTFGPNTLESFKVWTDQIPDDNQIGTPS
jgi:transglutaminase-like putative cysteine protease